MAFYGGLADLLVTAALDGESRADEVEIAIGLDRWWPTAGTRITGARNTATRLVIRDGALAALASPAPTRTWSFPEPLGDQPVVQLPFSEVITIARHLDVGELRSYLNSRPLDDLRDAETPPPTAVDEGGRSAQQFVVDAVVRRGSDTRRVSASGRDIYAVTAPIVVEGVVRLLDGRHRGPGAKAPGEAFDADDVLAALERSVEGFVVRRAGQRPNASNHLPPRTVECVRRTGWLAVLALLAALAGCGGDDEPGGSPEAESTSASPTASATSADDVELLFREAIKPLVDQPVIDFRHDVYSGPALAIETKGRAFQQVGWQSTTTSPKELGSSEAPQGEDVKGSMDVRAVDADLYMQLSTWEKPLAGCWLRTGPGQVPGGQLAMTPGVPGFVTLLGALRPEVVVQQEGDTIVIGAEVPLRIGFQLLTTGVLGLVQLDASQLDGASVPVGVKLTDGVLTEVELQGADLVSAVRAAGGDVPPDAEITLSQLRISVSYKAGPPDAPQVTAPADDLVMTNADVKANTGC